MCERVCVVVEKRRVNQFIACIFVYAIIMLHICVSVSVFVYVCVCLPGSICLPHTGTMPVQVIDG